MWKTASASLPSHKEPCTKIARAGPIPFYPSHSREEEGCRFCLFILGECGEIKEGVHTVFYLCGTLCACFPRLLEQALTT